MLEVLAALLWGRLGELSMQAYTPLHTKVVPNPQQTYWTHDKIINKWQHIASLLGSHIFLL